MLEPGALGLGVLGESQVLDPAAVACQRDGMGGNKLVDESTNLMNGIRLCFGKTKTRNKKQETKNKKQRTRNKEKTNKQTNKQTKIEPARLG